MHVNPPSRREFVTFAAATTLASSLPASAQTNDNLALDLIGPMAVQWNDADKRFYAWMPNLPVINTTKPSHEAGIITPVTSFAFDTPSPTKNDKSIDGPSGYISGPKPAQYPGNSVTRSLFKPQNAQIPVQYFVKMSLPLPSGVVPIFPVSCRIWPDNLPEPTDQPFVAYATGLRLLYTKANTPLLTPPQLLKEQVIRFDPSPDEAQKDMTISYTPYNTYDSTYSSSDPNNDPKDIFKKLNNSLNLHLQIDIQGPSRATQHMPCRSPMILLA